MVSLAFVCVLGNPLLCDLHSIQPPVLDSSQPFVLTLGTNTARRVWIDSLLPMDGPVPHDGDSPLPSDGELGTIDHNLDPHSDR